MDTDTQPTERDGLASLILSHSSAGSQGSYSLCIRWLPVSLCDVGGSHWNCASGSTALFPKNFINSGRIESRRDCLYTDGFHGLKLMEEKAAGTIC